VAPGPHHFDAHYQGGGFFLYPDDPVTADIDVADSGDPWGFMQVGNGVSTTSRNVVVTAFPSLLPVAIIALSNDGATWTERTLWTYQQDWVLSPGNGLKTVYLKWHGPADSWSPVQSATIQLDAGLPTATGPTRTLMPNTSLASGRVPVRLSWSGVAGGSPISAFDLQQSTDGGAYGALWSGSSTSLLRNLGPGHAYRFPIRAHDTAGNTGPWTYGTSFRLTAVSQASGAVRYAGTWATSTSATTWLGGTAKNSSRAWSTASYRFTGKSIAWVGLKGPGRGKASVYVNGVWKATVDLYSATTLKQRIVWSANYSTSATRTITIKVLGTAGRPRVDIDGFIVAT
jgi:hypothetical protein